MHFEVRTRTVLTPAARDASRANVSRIIIYYNLRAPEKKEKKKQNLHVRRDVLQCIIIIIRKKLK